MAKKGDNKWGKYNVLRGSKKLAASHPETRRLSEASLWGFVSRFGTVILKPSGGSGGAGVIQVSSRGNGRYGVQFGNRVKTIEGKWKTYRFIRQRTRGRPYIVQRRISLAKVGSRPFDLRVMVQRRKRSSGWNVTGKLAKVAGKGYIITNIARSRGTVLPAGTAIQRSSLRNISGRNLLAEVDRVALQAARRLALYYPGKRTVGFDIGIDGKGRVWIIEANFRPMTSLFLKLKDKSMYRRIMSYKKAKGRK